MTDVLSKKENVEFEPKCSNRFICEFIDSTGLFIQKFAVYYIDRPKVEINFDNMGKRKFKWLPIDIKMYDPIVPNTTQSVWSHLERYECFDINLNVLGPTGDIVEQWKIANANIIFVDFGSLDWTLTSNKDFSNILLKIKYEYAKLIV